MPRALVAAPAAAAIAMPAMPMQPPAGRTATTTVLSVAPNPASLTAPITLTAAVAVVPPATGTPTGLVRFRANGAVINMVSLTLGKDLQAQHSGSLGAPAPIGGAAVTITSSDPSKVVLSSSRLGADATSITLNVGSGSQSIPGFWVRALSGVGSVQVNVSAPGYAPTSFTVTLVPSGFVISAPGNFTTTGGAANTTVTIAAARLDAGTLASVATQELRPGVTATVQLESSNTAAGVLTVTSLSFVGGDSTKTTQVDPQPVASSTSSIIRFVAGTTPPGFSQPSTLQQITATINP